MTIPRRHFIKLSLALLSAHWPWPTFAIWPAQHFATCPLDSTLKQLFNNQPIIESKLIDITAPLIAENGAVVPVTVLTSLPSVKKLYILVEKNPVPLCVIFTLTEHLQPQISARLKMAETSDIIAIAETPTGLFQARLPVKVTIGGCGG